MNFTSDNASGASAAVLEAVAAASAGPASAYGDDPHTRRAEAMLSEVFEREVASFFVLTGTAANALALACLAPPWGAIFCHEHAHVMDDECGAPEMFTDGAKLVGVPGARGKLDPAGLARALGGFPRGGTRQVQPAALSLSQANESGCVYALDEIAALSATAHEAGLRVHMDGARFVNALVTLGCTPAQMTWKAGVDVLAFGATKNGTLACEAVVFFDPALARDFPFRRKRAGQTLSKSRFLGAQMTAYLHDDHWLTLGARANMSAQRLAAGLRATGVRLPWPVEANEVFAMLPRGAAQAAWAAGARWYEWGERGLSAHETPRAHEVFVRLVTSFATAEDEIDALVGVLKSAAMESPVLRVG